VPATPTPRPVTPTPVPTQPPVVTPTPAPPAAPRTFTFEPRGRQGESLSYDFAVSRAGNVSLTATVPNNTTVTYFVLDPMGREVFRETFRATSARTFPVTVTGNYRATVRIDAGNGNTNLRLSITAP
jgi:hypothetical protein